MAYKVLFNTSGHRDGPPPTTLATLVTYIAAKFLEELIKRNYILYETSLTAGRANPSSLASFSYHVGTTRDNEPTLAPEFPENVWNKFRDDLKTGGWTVDDFKIDAGV